MIIKLILREHVLIKFIYDIRQVARESVLINSNAGRLVISATINPDRRWGEATKTHRVLESAIEYRLSNVTPDIRVTRGAFDEKCVDFFRRKYDNYFCSMHSVLRIWATSSVRFLLYGRAEVNKFDGVCSCAQVVFLSRPRLHWRLEKYGSHRHNNSELHLGDLPCSDDVALRSA